MSRRWLRKSLRSRSNQQNSPVPTNGENVPSTTRQSSDTGLPSRSLPPGDRERGGIRTSTAFEVGSSNNVLIGVGGGRNPEELSTGGDRYRSTATTTPNIIAPGRDTTTSELDRGLRGRRDQDDDIILLDHEEINPEQDNGHEPNGIKNGVDIGDQPPEDSFGHRLVRRMLRPLRPGALRDFTRRRRAQIMQQLRDFDRLFH